MILIQKPKKIIIYIIFVTNFAEMKYGELLRIRHWVKNLFIFIPLLVTGEFMALSNLYITLKAFLFFCFAASFIYLINDYIDLEKDKLHPVKKNRPLAKGSVSKTHFFIVLSVLIFLLSYPFYMLSRDSMVITYSYIALNLVYTFWGKRISILDIMFISSGFVLRVITGVVILGLIASPWIIILTFSLSMLLALGKRRGELLIKTDISNKRKALAGYNITSINAMQVIFSCVSIIVYSMYTFFNENFPGNRQYLIYSLFPVIFGILRYLQINFSEEHIEEPTDILYKDKRILISLITWILFIVFLILWSK